MALLTINDGIVTLGSTLIDAVLISCNLSTSVRYDAATKDSRSSSIKRPIGFNDSEINIEFALLSDDRRSCYDRLSSINKLFKARENGVAKVYNINNRHLFARGIRSVIFDRITSSESNTDDTIKVSLTFTEHTQADQNIENIGSNPMTDTLSANSTPTENTEMFSDVAPTSNVQSGAV